MPGWRGALRIGALLIGFGLGAQQPAPMEAFGRHFREACAALAAGDLSRAAAEFAAADEWIDRLPVERRAQAAFFGGVRRGELALRGGDPAAARAQLLATRDAARSAPAVRDKPVYGGIYRVLLWTLLWSCMPEHEVLELLDEDDEAAFLLDPATAREVDQRMAAYAVPLQLLAAELLLWRGQEVEAVARLQELADVVRADAGVAADWRDRCLVRLAFYFAVRADYDRAELYLEQVSAAGAREPRAVIALRRGDVEGALAVARELAAADPAKAALAGEALEQLGRHAEALEQHRIALRHTPPARDLVQHAVARANIAECLLELGQLDQAGAALAEAFAALDSAPPSRRADAERAQMLTDAGLLAERRGQPDQALVRYQQALERLDDARRRLPFDPLGSSWLRTHLGSALEPAIEGVVRTAADNWVALAAVEFGKARSLLDLLTAPSIAAPDDALRRAMQALAVAGDAAETAALRQEVERLRAAARRTAPRAEAPSADALRSQLAAARGGVFLSYWLGRKRAWLLAVTGAGAELACARYDLGARDAVLQDVVAAFRAVALRAADPDPALQAAAERLLPAAVRGALVEGAVIVFCPDPVFERVPFEALPLGGAPLGVRHDVEWAPSLAVRDALRARPARGRAIVCVDGVEVTPTLRREFGVDPLVHGALEGDLVVAAYAGALPPLPIERLTGAAASLEALSATLKRAATDVLHINAHAVVRPFVPSSSALLLASGPEFMPSFAHQPLDGAIVVLSACASATGEARGGEGVAGLLWGPLGAGARGVVASRWQVNQESTARLMGGFHRARAAGAGEARALRLARQELLRDAATAHPYYWAGFVSYGGRSGNVARTLESVRYRRDQWLWPVGGALIVAVGISAAFAVARRKRRRR